MGSFKGFRLPDGAGYADSIRMKQSEGSMDVAALVPGQTMLISGPGEKSIIGCC